jgi:hypothetical protein
MNKNNSISVMIGIICFLIVFITINVTMADNNDNNIKTFGHNQSINEFDIRISGIKTPVKIVEFLTRNGTRCVLAYKEYGNTMDMELYCRNRDVSTP